MRTRPFLLALALLGCKDSAAPPPLNAMEPGRPMPAGALVIDFEAEEDGTVPSGFTSVVNKGRPGVWQVERVADPPSGANAVVQTDADRTNSRFPLLVYDNFRATDIDLSVRFQPVSGRIDQAAGLVWRYRDVNNYYVVRANALEDNVVLYKVENGKRSDLPVKGAGGSYGVKADVPDQGWGELRVTARGSLFEVYLGERKLFEVDDRTFTGSGKVGLWTKADSVTRFDDLRIANLDAASQPSR